MIDTLPKDTSIRAFDWVRAARLIADHPESTFRAGLGSDWDYTGGTIWENGKPVPHEDTYTYLASTWAIPEIEIDGKRIPCWKLEDRPVYSMDHTYWPDEALRIVRHEPLLNEEG